AVIGQHAVVWLGHAVEQMTEEAVGLRVPGVVLQIRPLLGGLADDAAGAMPGGAACDLAEYHHACEQGGGVAAGKTGLHPAYALTPRRVMGLKLLGLQRVVPVHVAVEAAGFSVHLEVDGLLVHYALEHVPARAGPVLAARIHS